MSIMRPKLFVVVQCCWACLASALALASNGTVSSDLASSAGNVARAGQSTLLAAWSDLWRTADQQAQAMLDAGEPAQAAARFHDPRRRAYADLEAGQNQEAAKLLQPFTDAESEYNRGNALAKTGQLQEALAAYDAALKQSPADKDIRRNRDLVERALRQQPNSPQSNPGNGKQGGQNGGSAGRRQQSGQSGAGQQGGGASAQSGGSSQSGDRESRGNGRGSQPGNQESSSAGGQLASNGSGNPNEANSGSPSMTGRDAGDTQGGAGQARRDAAAAAAYARGQQRQQQGRLGNASPTSGSGRNGTPESAQKGARGMPDAQDLVAGGTQNPKQKPETERQLALDQWLRQIPDSPAGLLQRKFLIEHMIKQQQSGDQTGDSP